MAIEESSYSVLVTQGNFELRRYSSYIVAETFVEGDFEGVGNEGFRRLLGYMGGRNRKKESISMKRLRTLFVIIVADVLWLHVQPWSDIIKKG